MRTRNRPKKAGNHTRTHLMLAALAIGNGLGAYAVVKQMNPAERSFEDAVEGSELYAYNGLNDFPDQAAELAYRADNFRGPPLASAVMEPEPVLPAALPVYSEPEIRKQPAVLATPRNTESRLSKRSFTHKVEYDSPEIVPLHEGLDTNISSRVGGADASSPPQLVVVPPPLPAPAASADTEQSLADPVLPYPLFGTESQPADDGLSAGTALADPIAHADEGLLDGDPVQTIRINPVTEPGIPVTAPSPPQDASNSDVTGLQADIQAQTTIESAG
jgi:hypothetical protein